MATGRWIGGVLVSLMPLCGLPAGWARAADDGGRQDIMMVMQQPGVREPSRMSAKDKAVLAGEGKG